MCCCTAMISVFASRKLTCTRLFSSNALSSKTALSSNNRSVLMKTPLANTALSMFLGLSTIIASTTAVNYTTINKAPDFDPKKERFDQSSFSGRFFGMLLSCDPCLLLYSDDEIRRYEKKVNQYQDILALSSNAKSVHQELWEARRIVNSAIHPDTGEIIPRPFRMSGWVVYNGPICVAMVASTKTPALLFWGLINQSQNALVNYFNAPLAMPNDTVIKGYSLAVVSALGVVSGLSLAIRKSFRPDKAKELLKFISFPSCVLASMLNCYAMRKSEIITGVPLFDAEGKIVQPEHTSQVAAKEGVYSTIASRAVLPAPTFLIPPLLLNTQYIKKLLTKHAALSLPISTFLIIICFGIGLPGTIAIFPQMSEICLPKLEEHYQGLIDDTGVPYTKLYYNKGL